MKEKKARVEDAMHATKAAVEEGIVPRGGVALLRASKGLIGLKLGGEQQIGVNIVARAIEEPLRWIAINAGQEGSIVVAKVKHMGHDEGFNALNDKYENLVHAGVGVPLGESAFPNGPCLEKLFECRAVRNPCVQTAHIGALIARSVFGCDTGLRSRLERR
jgi:TCP-1/cpn60 chaperonin family protein